MPDQGTAKSNELWGRRRSVVVKACDCRCQLTYTAACCEHSDKRRLAPYYKSYTDGTGNEYTPFRYIYYCPICKDRCESQSNVTQNLTNSVQAKEKMVEQVSDTSKLQNNEIVDRDEKQQQKEVIADLIHLNSYCCRVFNLPEDDPEDKGANSCKAQNQELWENRRLAVTKDCGCKCQLTDKTKCCVHADRRSGSLTGFYKSYYDGMGDQYSAYRYSFYCPTCKARSAAERIEFSSLKPQSQASESLSQDDDEKIRCATSLKAEAICSASSGSRQDIRFKQENDALYYLRQLELTKRNERLWNRWRSKKGQNNHVTPKKCKTSSVSNRAYHLRRSNWIDNSAQKFYYAPSRRVRNARSKKQNRKPILNTIDESMGEECMNQNIESYNISSDSNELTGVDFYARMNRTNVKSSKDFDLLSEAWPDLYVDASALFQEESVSLGSYENININDETIGSWDIVSDAQSIMSFETFTSDIRSFIEPRSYLEALLQESVAQPFVSVRSSTNTKVRDTYKGQKTSRMISKLSEANEVEFDLSSIRDGVKGARGGKKELMFCGNPKIKSWNGRYNYDLEGKVLIESRQKRDLRRRCRHVSKRGTIV